MSAPSMVESGSGDVGDVDREVCVEGGVGSMSAPWSSRSR